jgi:hypothetical protein
MSKPAAIAKCWTFASSSGSGRYQTLQYVGGSTSCDCPGWCRRVAADGSRSCRHTRSVLMGTADRECESMHDYEIPAAAPGSAAPPARPAVAQFGEMGRRKIQT